MQAKEDEKIALNGEVKKKDEELKLLKKKEEEWDAIAESRKKENEYIQEYLMIIFAQNKIFVKPKEI